MLSSENISAQGNNYYRNSDLLQKFSCVLNWDFLLFFLLFSRPRHLRVYEIKKAFLASGYSNVKLFLNAICTFFIFAFTTSI